MQRSFVLSSKESSRRGSDNSKTGGSPIGYMKNGLLLVDDIIGVMGTLGDGGTFPGWRKWSTGGPLGRQSCPCPFSNSLTHLCLPGVMR